MNLSTDDLTGLNDLISHHNLSDFNDLDCLFDLKKCRKMLWFDLINDMAKNLMLTIYKMENFIIVAKDKRDKL